jgi:hypothetical protein
VISSTLVKCLLCCETGFCKFFSTLKTIYPLHYIFDNTQVGAVVSWMLYFQYILKSIREAVSTENLTTLTCEIPNQCLESIGKHNLRFPTTLLLWSHQGFCHLEEHSVASRWNVLTGHKPILLLASERLSNVPFLIYRNQVEGRLFAPKEDVQHGDILSHTLRTTKLLHFEIWLSEHTKATILVSKIWREAINSVHKCKECGKIFSFTVFSEKHLECF